LAVARCPDCGTEVEAESPQLGEILVCTGCGADLEVISLDPLTIEVYEQEEK
jgi:alpha-aminoadipate carrier protein LysW